MIPGDVYDQHFPGLDKSLSVDEHLKLCPDRTNKHIWLVPASSRKWLLDDNEDITDDFDLCRYRRLTRREIFEYICFSPQNYDAAGTLQILNKTFYTIDNGYWETMRQWLYKFCKEWRATIMELIEQNDTPVEALIIASNLLGIPLDTLLGFVEHRTNLEVFMEQNRGMLAVLAESKLWGLVNAGDPATVRWVLSRVRKDIYGDQQTGQNTTQIEIIESEGAI